MENVEKLDEYIEKQIELKLNNLLKSLPDKIPQDYHQKPIYSYTISELYKNTLQTVIDVLNELTELFSHKEKISYEGLYDILFKDNRKVYLGIILVLFSFIIYFIDGASV